MRPPHQGNDDRQNGRASNPQMRTALAFRRMLLRNCFWAFRLARGIRRHARNFRRRRVHGFRSVRIVRHLLNASASPASNGARCSPANLPDITAIPATARWSLRYAGPKAPAPHDARLQAAIRPVPDPPVPKLRNSRARDPRVQSLSRQNDSGKHRLRPVQAESLRCILPHGMGAPSWMSFPARRGDRVAHQMLARHFCDGATRAQDVTCLLRSLEIRARASKKGRQKSPAFSADANLKTANVAALISSRCESRLNSCAIPARVRLIPLCPANRAG